MTDAPDLVRGWTAWVDTLSEAVDTAPAPGGTVGQVIVAGPDEDERRRLATGIGEYLRLLVAAGVPAPEFPHPDDPAGAGRDSVYWWDVPALR